VAGARRENPAVQARATYLNNWDDPAAGREAALALLRVGADVLHHNADQAGLGVFRAASETSRAWVIGANADQTELAPERVLGSAVLDLPHAFLLVARRVQSGEWRPEVLEFGLASDVVRWEANPALDSLTPPDLDARVAAVEDSIRAGSLTPLPSRTAAP
jgi:basic membrane protein A